MSKVTVDHAISLDGFSTGPNVTPDNPMGDEGERLHSWMFDDGVLTDRGAEFQRELFGPAGAVVMGRHMFDLGFEPWGNNPPYHMPVFVVTHRAGNPLPMEGGTTYNFVTDGIDAALKLAKATAGEKDVVVIGGATTVRQFIDAGLVDELRIHVADLMLGDGTRLFDQRAPKLTALEKTRVLETPGATHITFRIPR